ncbi:unnamed protein product [Dicrocoelium dendriticum]|nr:unnamed protein product [Dicrocoelium dendriticum]
MRWKSERPMSGEVGDRGAVRNPQSRSVTMITAWFCIIGMSHLSELDANLDCDCILDTAAELDAVIDAVTQLPSAGDASFTKLLLDRLKNRKHSSAKSSLLLTDLLQSIFRKSCEQYESMLGAQQTSEEPTDSNPNGCLSANQLDRLQQLHVELQVASRRFAELDIHSDESLRAIPSEHVREFRLLDPDAFLVASRNLERLSKAYRRLQSGLDKVSKLTSSVPTLSDHPEFEIADQILAAPLDEL